MREVLLVLCKTVDVCLKLYFYLNVFIYQYSLFIYVKIRVKDGIQFDQYFRVKLSALNIDFTQYETIVI